jgi:SHS family lactate transporter-like MFS transporter
MIMAVSGHERQIVAACYLGWTLDAFDYFIMAFALDDVAKEFQTSRTVVTWAFTLTLAARPLGAFLFGRLADRYGRRPTLMANVLVYSVLEFASGFAPTLASFLVLRMLYGVAMGGEWGVGASLTMESVPRQWRGIVSGLLQAGYPSGFLLATILNAAAYHAVGWRGMFMLGVLPAFLVLFIRRNVPESPEWIALSTRPPERSFANSLRQHSGLLVYCVIMMAAFNFYSHGTQDLFKSFLTVDHGLSLRMTTSILIAMNLAAIAGGFLCAGLSQHIGRRRTIVGAALLSLPVIPLWALSNGAWSIGLGAVLIQFLVQGAWGVIPAHLNELSPPEIRGTFPGLTYQVGNLIAAGNSTIQSSLADRFFHKNLSWPLAIVTGIVALIIVFLVAFGREARDVRMGAERRSPA